MEWLLSNAPAMILALGVIVFVHELGHFLAAKLFGVRVLTFSLGFGPRLWGFSFRGTDCRISLVPLGGYVRMGGELAEEATGEPGDFVAKPRWQRIIVYLAGPAMNVVLSVGLIAGVFMQGFDVQALQDTPAVVGVVQPGSPAQRAGLAPGDHILTVDGQAVSRWKDVAFAFLTAPGRPVELTLERSGATVSTAVTPEEVPRYGYGEAGVYPQLQLRISEVVPGSPAERAGFRPGDVVRAIDHSPVFDAEEDFVAYIEAHEGREVTVEVARGERTLDLQVVPEASDGHVRIGVGLGFYRRLPLGEALVESVRFNLDIVEKSVALLGKLVTRQIAAKSALSGPIEIAAWSGQAARRGVKDLLYTIGFLSISIGFMNLLPIPVLDGGHIFILLVESLLRRDLSVVIKERIAQLGFMVLMTLMAVVIFFDLAKNLPSLFPGS